MQYEEPGLISLSDTLYVSALCNNGSSDTQKCVNGGTNSGGYVCNNGKSNDGGPYSLCNNGGKNHSGSQCNNGKGNLSQCINGGSTKHHF